MPKTVPNQKIIKVSKQPCDKQHYYSAINLVAMEEAAINLDAGAFKLWMYFAKNQNNYEFALSSKDAEANFGIKIKQYNNAVAELMNKGYLVNTKGNNYIFNEKPVMPFEDNAVITKSNNAVITKEDKKYYKDTTKNNSKKFDLF